MVLGFTQIVPKPDQVNIESAQLSLLHATLRPHMARQLCLRDEIGRAAQQVAHDGELAWREVQPAPANESRAGALVDGDATDTVDCECARCAAKVRVYASHQLFGSERLDQVIVGSDFQSDNLVGLLCATRDHHDGACDAALAQVFQQIHPVAIGQPPIEQDDVGRRAASLGKRGGGAIRGANRVSCVSEDPPNAPKHVRVIVDEQDLSPHDQARVPRGDRALQAPPAMLVWVLSARPAHEQS